MLMQSGAWKHLVVLLGVVLVLGGLALAVYRTVHKGQGVNPSYDQFLAIQFGVPLALALVGIFLKPVRDLITTSYAEVVEHWFRQECRVFIFGHGRAGKTTLIASLVSVRTPESGVETGEEDADTYRVRVLLDFTPVRYLWLRGTTGGSSRRRPFLWISDS